MRRKAKKTRDKNINRCKYFVMFSSKQIDENVHNPVETSVNEYTKCMTGSSLTRTSDMKSKTGITPKNCIEFSCLDTSRRRKSDCVKLNYPHQQTSEHFDPCSLQILGIELKSYFPIANIVLIS